MSVDEAAHGISTGEAEFPTDIEAAQLALLASNHGFYPLPPRRASFMPHNPFYRKRLRITRENGRYIAKDERSGQAFILDGEWEVSSILLDAAELLHAAEVVKGVIPATQG